MENLNNEFDTDYVNNLRKREPAKDVYRDDDEYMSPEEANFRYLQALASVQKEESQRRKIKLRKIAVGGAVVVPLTAAAIGTTILGVNIANKNTEKYLAEATSSVATYDNNHILDDPNSEISIRLANDVNKKDNLVKYINCSNELHKLHLSQFPDITIIDEEVEWKDPEVVEQLIEEYKEYYKKQSFKQHFNVDYLVGDDVITFNYQVYELKELEKMYNEKVFEGYGYLEDYTELSTKFYLADIYGGKPEQYTVNSDNYQTSEYPEITGPGINYHDGFDSDLLDYAKIINDVRKAENANTDKEPDEFNSDRNRFMLQKMAEMNVSGANVINDIQKQRYKEIEESQKKFKEFSEMNKSK